MVDVLSNCAQAVYSKWDDTSKRSSSSSSTAKKNVARSARKERYRNHAAELHQQARDRELFRSKENCWTGFSFKQTRPLMGACCKTCTPNSKIMYLKPGPLSVNFSELTEKSDGNAIEDEYLDDHLIGLTQNKSVRNILRPPSEADKSFIIRTFSHLTHNLRLKKFDYPQVAGSVLIDKRLREAIETTAQTLAHSVPEEEQNDEQYKQILTEQEARARRILLDMKSTLSDFLLRITSWILYKLLPRFLTSVCLHPSQLEMLQKAAETNLPLIFVPLHRSHLDYILITFILLNINVKSPLVAAGNNLKIPVFGWLLRGLGAFFIKRRIDPAAGRKDVLYRAVLHTYMVQCLEAGHNIEFYIEGGRTRTGKPCMPKGGLLSVIIDAYMAGRVQDALLVPVSVNYDKLVDGNFIRELSGQPKEMETFSSAMSAIWTALNSNYGSMRIDFNQPFSLKELVKSFQMMNKMKRQSSSDLGSAENSPSKNGFAREKVFRSIPSTTSLYGTDVVDEDHRVLVDGIARHLVYDCAKACAVMSTNILAFLLLNKYRNGVDIKELVVSFDKLRELLLYENKDMGFSGLSIDVINSAVDLLGPNLVARETRTKRFGETYEAIAPVTQLPNVIELSYYSNTLLPHFMIEGVLGLAIQSSARKYRSLGDDEIKMTGEDVINGAMELCDILQFEFIFAKPCQTLEDVINRAFEKFQLMEIIVAEENFLGNKQGWRKKFTSHYESEDDDDFDQAKTARTRIFFVNNRTEEVQKLNMYSMLLRPLLDAYIVTAMCLPSLLNKCVPENDFVQEVLSQIQIQLDNGSCTYAESYSVEPIKNACKLFKKWGILSMVSEDSVRVLSLTEEYSYEKTLQSIEEKFNYYK